MVLRAFAERTRAAMGRFRKAESGIAAVEFGLLAVPFFLITMGLAELGMIALTQASLDDGVTTVARGIRVGVTQANGLSYDEVQQQLCDRFSLFIVADCETNLFLDTETFNSYVAISSANPIAGGQFQSGGFGFDPGSSSSIVVVRAFYRWHIMTPGLASIFQNVDNGDRILASSIMFRNEPF